MLEVLQTIILTILVLLGPLGLIGIVIAIIKRKFNIFILSLVSLSIFLLIFIPSFIPPSDRAKEGILKSDMHSIQLVVGDYRTKYNGLCPIDTTLLRLLPKNLKSKGAYHDYSRLLKTDFKTKSIIEPPSKEIGYMIGYTTNIDKSQYVLIGTDKHGKPIYKLE
jgi:hypothetical protein